MRSQVLALTVAGVLTGSGLFAQELQKRAVFNGHTFEVQGMALSPDGKVLASGGGDTRGGELKLWDAATGKEIAALAGYSKAGYSNALSALAFSPDGKLIACGDTEMRVMLWDVAAHKHLATIKAPAYRASALAFSPDSNLLALAGDREVKLWDIKGAKIVSSFKRLSRPGSMAFSPDLKTLAAPNYQEIELWDVVAGREQALLSEHRGAVGPVAFSSDGRTLAAASTWSRHTPHAWISSGQVKLWDVANARERVTFPGNFGGIFGLALSPDGNALAVLDARDRRAYAELKLLDVATRREVLRHKCDGLSVLAVTFAADGTLYLVESLDGKRLKLWQLPRRKENKDVP